MFQTYNFGDMQVLARILRYCVMIMNNHVNMLIQCKNDNKENTTTSFWSKTSVYHYRVTT